MKYWLTGKRHKPVSCRSRWRKTLGKRYRRTHPNSEIVSVHPGSPFMDVKRRPKTDEERKALELESLNLLAVFGTASLFPGVLSPLEAQRAT